MEKINQLLKILLENDFDCVVIGGYAALLHGSLQVTRDVDICLEITPTVIEKLRSCLKEFHPVHRMTPKKLSFLDHPDQVTAMNNLYILTDLGVIDLLSNVSGVGDFQSVKKDSIEISIMGEKCRVISIEKLIQSKKFMGRPKDVATIKELQCVLDERDKEK